MTEPKQEGRSRATCSSPVFRACICLMISCLVLFTEVPVSFLRPVSVPYTGWLMHNSRHNWSLMSHDAPVFPVFSPKLTSTAVSRHQHSALSRTDEFGSSAREEVRKSRAGLGESSPQGTSSIRGFPVSMVTLLPQHKFSCSVLISYFTAFYAPNN